MRTVFLTGSVFHIDATKLGSQEKYYYLNFIAHAQTELEIDHRPDALAGPNNIGEYNAFSARH